MNSQQNSQNWQKESKVSRFLCEKGQWLKKKYSTAGGGGGDNYQLCTSTAWPMCYWPTTHRHHLGSHLCAPVMPELCHLDKGKYKHNAKKQTQIGRLLHWHYLLFILCYNVHLRPIKIGEAYLITPGRPLALALDLKRQQWPTTSRQRTKGCNCRGERSLLSCVDKA